MGGPTYNYSNQIMYSQPQTLFMQNQTAYLQPSVHVPLPQNYNMQGLGNQVAYRQEVLPQVPPPVQVESRVTGQHLKDPNMIFEVIR